MRPGEPSLRGTAVKLETHDADAEAGQQKALLADFRTTCSGSLML